MRSQVFSAECRFSYSSGYHLLTILKHFNRTQHPHHDHQRASQTFQRWNTVLNYEGYPQELREAWPAHHSSHWSSIIENTFSYSLPPFPNPSLKIILRSWQASAGKLKEPGGLQTLTPCLDRLSQGKMLLQSFWISDYYLSWIWYLSAMCKEEKLAKLC